MSKVRRVDWRSVREARENLRRIAREHPELMTKPSKTNRDSWERTLEDAMAKETKDEQIVVRLPGSLLKRIDAYGEQLRGEMPGPAWKRADVVRLLLAKALDALAQKRTSKR